MTQNLPEPALRDWLRAQIAEYLDLAPAEIADDVPLSAYGVDSVYALAILADIEERLELALDPELIWDYPTIAALSAFLHTALAPGLPGVRRRRRVLSFLFDRR
jgi:acyl carrier protein